MKKMKGFTLLDLMIVIAIIVITATLIVPVFQEHLPTQREAQQKQANQMNPGYGCIEQSTTVFGTSQE